MNMKKIYIFLDIVESPSIFINLKKEIIYLKKFYDIKILTLSYLKLKTFFTECEIIEFDNYEIFYEFIKKNNDVFIIINKGIYEVIKNFGKVYLHSRDSEIPMIPIIENEFFEIKEKNKNEKKEILFPLRSDKRKDLEFFVCCLSKLSKKYILNVYSNVPLLLLYFPYNIPIRFYLDPSIEEIVSLYSKCDLFLSCPFFRYLSCSELQAMASKVPVVSIDTHDNLFLKNEENCFLTPKYDTDKFVDKIVYCLDNRNENMINNAYNESLKYKKDTVLDKLKNNLEKVILD